MRVAPQPAGTASAPLDDDRTAEHHPFLRRARQKPARPLDDVRPNDAVTVAEQAAALAVPASTLRYLDRPSRPAHPARVVRRRARSYVESISGTRVSSTSYALLLPYPLLRNSCRPGGNAAASLASPLLWAGPATRTAHIAASDDGTCQKRNDSVGQLSNTSNDSSTRRLVGIRAVDTHRRSARLTT